MLKVSPHSRVPARKRIKCFNCFQCASPGLDINLHNLFTVNAKSGRVQHAMKLIKAMRLRYSVVVVFCAGSLGQSCFVKTAPVTEGVEAGLHFSIFARSNKTQTVLD